MAFKPSRVKAPASPSVYKVEVDHLLGIDTTTSDNNVSLSRACGISYFDVEQNGGDIQPGMCNFIRTNYGEIGKRCGDKEVDVLWRRTLARTDIVKTLGNITVLAGKHDGGYGNNNRDTIIVLIHENEKYDTRVIHLHDNSEVECQNISLSEKKCIILWDKRLVIVDMTSIYSEESIVAVEFCGSKSYCPKEITKAVYEMEYNGGYQEGYLLYAPTIQIASSPEGKGGMPYESVNALSPWVKETYCGDGNSKIFKFSLEVDSNYDISATVTNIKYRINAQLIISTETGECSCAFDEAPPKPDVTGEANVIIRYCRKNFVAPTMITGCALSCNFGVGGYKDRLFVSGNPEYPNRVWYSGLDEYCYFPDVNYLDFSDRACTIKGLSGHDTSLAVITDDNCYLVSASVNNNALTSDTHDAVFTISHIFESAKPAGYPELLVFNNEVVYMSKYGLAAITPSNVMDERYVQLRSERINEWLLNEELDQLQCCICGDFFVINNKKGRLYLLDGNTFSSTASKPFSQRQYEGYIWDVGADHVWSQDEKIFFMCGWRLYFIPISPETEDETYVNESGGTVHCYWETPNIYGADFYAKKSFTKFALLLRKNVSNGDKTEVNTTVRVWAKRDQQPWKLIKDYDGEQSVFRYDYLNYGLFSYRSSGKRYAIDKKIKFKKTYGLKLRFENDVEGMPCYLQSFGVEYCK